ncbi:MAG TPA: hypothetical protein PK096_01405 [Candidatus Saccharibacteria bacterium]|nr:hypothetical protein [Candidatus Saccharibacteria bacterium]HRK94006.1 hypothetical protein [Candidatus Saccharibacteria bacterium]
MMKRLRNAILSFGILAFLASALLSVVAVSPAMAKDDKYFGDGDGCSTSFLTFPTWYEGLPRDGCAIDAPQGSGKDGGNISAFVWRIVLNIIEIALQAVAYAAVGFIIFGGYKYLISISSPDRIVTARKTILNAIIGLVISILSVAIVNLVAGGIKP